MASYVWPVTLPQQVNRDMGGDGGVRALRTPMDRGTPKMRYIGERAEQMPVKFHMSTAQLATLKTFVNETLLGVSRFDFVHPLTGGTVEVRIVPSSEGKYFDYNHFGHDQWLVSMTFEVMP